MKHIKRYITFIFICTSIASYSQDSLSLEQAIQTALDRNFDIVISKMEDTIAMTNNTWAATGIVPMLSFSGVSSNTLSYDLDDADSTTQLIQTSPSGDKTQNILNAGVTLNWMLFNGFKAIINKNTFEQLELLSEGNTTALVESTIQSVIKAYNQVLLEQEKMQLLDELQLISKDKYDYEKLKREYGNSNSLEELQAKTNWLSDKANFIIQQSIYRNALRNLKYTLNIADSVDCKLTDSIVIPEDSLNIELLTNNFLKNNANLKTLYINLELQKNDIKRAKSDYLPTLSLSTGAELTHTNIAYDNFDPIQSNSADVFANIALNFDIYKAGARKRAVEIATINKEIANIELEEIKRTLIHHLQNTYDLFNSNIQLLAVAEESKKAARLNVTLAEERLRNGTINSFNYRDIQLAYLQSTLQLLNAKATVISTYTELLRLSGSIVSTYK